ncbi:zinc-binding dehydrogenase [Paracoccus sp. S-4012]|uniref:NADP-dependent oxidoreductase n=1 Tax=Paracoccus sp. S-4012 TaxID=2665648 RepID=UPI0012AF8B4C|nr:NADP-dependent oxidoreductase [Paracoccus sp. S-4012]MRX51138.1 zinc-binding dehydrogenase [Paracoccus sp. S-4012]
MHRIVLARRPQGAPTPESFRLETLPLPQPGEGEVLVRVTSLSLDPYMRGRMDDAKSYAPKVELGEVMTGGGVGTVVESRAEGFAPGDVVFGMTGWADHAVLRGKELRKLREGLPASTALGVLGMPGFTGWYGLTIPGAAKAGETVVVAAATGPVGSMVGQIAKAKGLRAVGIAGGREKCAMGRDVFGFDAMIDHKAHTDARSLREELAAACPDGVDIYFENVGGMVLEAVLPLMNTHGRIPLCGTIAWYGGADTSGPDRLPKLWRQILVNRLSITGFIIFDHWQHFPDFMAEVAPMVEEGRLAYVEDVAEGLEAMPQTFISMLKGGNLGKQIVRLAPDPFG